MNYFEMRWRLCACRAQAGYTQKEVAEKIGTCEKTIVDWETGKTAPNMEKGKKLSELYGIPLTYMDFTKEGNGTPLRNRDKSDIPDF